MVKTDMAPPHYNFKDDGDGGDSKKTHREQVLETETALSEHDDMFNQTVCQFMWRILFSFVYDNGPPDHQQLEENADTNTQEKYYS